MLTPGDALFWEERYQTGVLGWDKGACAPPILRMVKEGVIPPGARVAVLGAGRGHEAFALAELGFAVTAIDFAPSAVESMKKEMERRPLHFDVLQEDIFAMRVATPFDAVLEHTCFCAIDVARRDDYVKAVHDMLKPGGILFGLFFAHPRPGGPPFATTEDEVRSRFGAAFDMTRLVRARDSFEGRVNEELEFVFRRR